jgi:hypothetical protein
LFCCREFVPNPRISEQKACSRKVCQKARHNQAQERWRRANPDVNRGLYPNTRRWLEKHPGYLRCYRATHPEYVAADNAARRRRHARRRRLRADIRDAFRRRKIEAIRVLRGADIQDTFRRQIEGVLTYLDAVAAPIYETG